MVGDLDSARADVLAAYEKNGCAVHRVEDQDANDLSKALAHVGRRWDAAGVSDGVVRVAGAFVDGVAWLAVGQQPPPRADAEAN